MFDEKLGNWKKITAGFGIFGFVLSFIVGLFGDVAAGAVFLRALLFSVLFAGISILVMKLVESFIPELLISPSSDEDIVDIEAEDLDDSAEAAKISGSNLDITIEDEMDSNTAEVEELETEELLETVDDDSELEDAAVAETVNTLDSEHTDDDSAENGKENVLPDVGVFSDSFSEANDGGNNEGLSNIDGFGEASGGAEILGGMHETSEIVKAVKTVLKKDQEG